jgi:hypothetical protein
MRFAEDYIRSEHGAVLDGITKIYETLKEMQYVSPEQLKYPPHENFPAQELASIGLEPEAIAIIRYLPYLDFDIGCDHDRIDISPMTNSFSYLRVDDIPEAPQVLWEGGNDLAP